MTNALYEIPKIIQTIGNVAEEYKKMNDDERGKLVWEGAKALIAGAMKYNPQKSLPAVYSLFMQNSRWYSTIDWFSGILKKYGGDGTVTVNDVLKKAAEDFIKNGVKN